MENLTMKKWSAFMLLLLIASSAVGQEVTVAHEQPLNLLEGMEIPKVKHEWKSDEIRVITTGYMKSEGKFVTTQFYHDFWVDTKPGKHVHVRWEWIQDQKQLASVMQNLQPTHATGTYANANTRRHRTGAKIIETNFGHERRSCRLPTRKGHWEYTAWFEPVSLEDPKKWRRRPCLFLQVDASCGRSNWQLKGGAYLYAIPEETIYFHQYSGKLEELSRSVTGRYKIAETIKAEAAAQVAQ